MARNIIIGVLIVACAVLFVYALVQKTDALEVRRQAEENLVLAKQNRAEAMEQAKIAKECTIATQRLLEECKTKNK